MTSLLRSNTLSQDDTLTSKSVQPIKNHNDIKEIRSIRVLDRINLDLESPRFKQACDNLGVDIAECQKKTKEDFAERGVDPDVVQLRFRHFQGRLIDTLNRVLEERRNIKNKLENHRSLYQEDDDPLLKSRMQAGRFNMLITPQSCKNGLNKSSSVGWFTSSQTLDEQRSKELERLDKNRLLLQNETKRVLEEDEYKRVRTMQQSVRIGKIDSFSKTMEQFWKQKAKENTDKRVSKAEYIKQLEIEKEQKRLQMEAEMKRNFEEKEKKLLEIEAERKKKVMEKQIEFKKRQNQIQKFHSDMGIVQQQMLDEQHRNINEKLYQTNTRHIQRISEQIDKTRDQNTRLDRKIQEFQEVEKKKKEEKLKRFQEYEKKVDKKITDCYKSMCSFWGELKEENKNKEHVHKGNKDFEEQLRKEQIDLLVKKANRTQINLQKYKNEKEHEFMLKREFRRLKEIDTVKTMERQKRLEAKKKAQILQKEQERTNAVQMFKEHQNFLMKTRSEINLQTSIEKEALRRTLHTITHSLASPKEKTKLLKGLHLNIEYPNSPGDDSKEEDGKGNESS